MTGFGKATKEFENKTVNVEIRSLNSKNADLNIRLSSVYRDKEYDLKTGLILTLDTESEEQIEDFVIKIMPVWKWLVL